MILSNIAIVTAHPVLNDEIHIAITADLRAPDASAVKQLQDAPKVLNDNTPYLGHEGCKQCGTSTARDYVEGIDDTDVTYCFTITNLGDATLGDIALNDDQLQFTTNGLGPLDPGASVMVPL